MNVDFEIYNAGPVIKDPERVHVSISKLGHIFLNRRALEAIGEPDAVTLMFDRRRNIIGVMPSALHRPQSFPLKRKDKRTSLGRMVYANNFFRHYSIRPTETFAFLDPKVNKDGILMLDLSDVRPIKRS